ncbi:MAG: hydantoinase B/oxoprolinase family protein [Chloroflexi bacterium]|nr:hydantoinase B/oxoprolinase family protein [Chloroflexota bacterium]
MMIGPNDLKANDGTMPDPLTIDAVWERVRSIATEMGATLMRTSFSTSARLNGDYTCAVFDDRGRMLAQVVQAGAAHLGGMLTIVPAFFERYPRETLQPGDAFVTNDPWLGAGHTPDIYVLTPVFRHARLIGLAGSCIHHVDVGGRRSAADSCEVYEEGLIIPPLRLYRAGVPNEDVLSFIRANVRLPEIVVGDLRAQIASNHVGATRLVELLEDYQLDDLVAVGDDIIKRTAHALREAIRGLDPGTYRNEACIDRFGDASVDSAPIRIAISVEVTESKLIVDLTGSSPRADGPINVVLNATRAYLLHGIKLATNTPVPNNVGIMDVFELRVPAGSLFNATFPAPVYWRMQPALHLPETLLRALEPAIPDGSISGSSPHWFTVIHGAWPDGRRFASWPHWAGGMGARPDRDGRMACFPADIADLPCETLEHEASVIVERRELIPDSGGPGRYRGGCGQRIVIRPLPAELGGSSDPLLATVIGARIDEPSPGIRGGGPAARGGIYVNGQRLPASRAQQLLSAEDTLTLEMGGGGGYGPVLERDPAAVREDVVNGLVSAEAALRDYGVVIDPATLSLDVFETERARRGR